jgi:hypothetical protein
MCASRKKPLKTFVSRVSKVNFSSQRETTAIVQDYFLSIPNIQSISDPRHYSF